MPSLTLPPRGVFVPTTLIYATDLPPAAFHTWVQLRGLALKGSETPPFTIQELSKLTGKSPSALYGHLAILRSSGALRWRSTGKGILTIVFDPLDEQADLSVGVEANAEHQPAPRPTYGDPNGESCTTELDSIFQESRFQESGITLSPSLNSFNNLKIKERGEREGGSLQDSGFQEIRLQDSGILENRKNGAGAGSDPIAIYRELTGRRPNQSQRAELLNCVTDPDLWRRTLAHWQVHGWNPGNFAGLLDLYQRGGPDACHFCGASRPEPPRSAPTRRRKPIDDLIAELQPDPKESHHGQPHRAPKNT